MTDLGAHLKTYDPPLANCGRERSVSDGTQGDHAFKADKNKDPNLEGLSRVLTGVNSLRLDDRTEEHVVKTSPSLSIQLSHFITLYGVGKYRPNSVA